MKPLFRLALSASAFCFFCLPIAAHAGQRSRHKALCSAYSAFTPCEVFVDDQGRVTSNIPRGYLDVNRSSILSVEVCDADVHCKPLLGENLKYVWKDARISPFAAVVDYRFRYKDDFGSNKTVIFRFYNRLAAEDFGKSLLAAAAIGSSS